MSTDFSDKIKTLSSRFQDIVGQDAFLCDSNACWNYGYDNSAYHFQPDAVIFPKTEQQIQDIIRLCYQADLPVVARGKGTATTGAALPVHGGLVLSTEHMRQIIACQIENRFIQVEPGITNQAVQTALKPHGFFFAPDPSSYEVCSIGGNLATNAGGPHALKYGATREHVLGLTCITGTGERLTTGTAASKCSTGYDLTRLIIGSEGTLGIITQARLKLTPLPEATTTLRLIYNSHAAACETVANIMSSHITPARLEFMDKQAINMIKQYSDVTFPEQAEAVLLIECHENQTALAATCQHIENIAKSTTGLLEYKQASDAHVVKALWAMRKALSPALRFVAPKKINEDVAVPVANLSKLLDGIDTLAKRFNITIVNFGHAGNGNIHVNLMIDPQDKTQLANADHCLHALFALVCDLDGTISGEHGTGIFKKSFLEIELGSYALDLMRKIKEQFDPKHILNPGKI